MSFVTLKNGENKYIYNSSVFLKFKGKFSDVFRGTDLLNNNSVIIKKFNPQLLHNSEAIERFCFEKQIDFNHPGLSKFIDCFWYENDLFLIRDFCEGTDLKAFASKIYFFQRFRESFWIKIFVQVLNALEYLHSQNIIHRDIRPANIILLDKEKDFKENPQVKLIDFGLAKNLDLEIVEQRVPFALVYSPPEQLLNFPQLVNKSSDLYSLAITMYELITGKKAFYNSNPEFLMNLMLTNELHYEKRISKPMFDILIKASSKYKFTKPPHFFSKTELFNNLCEGAAKRYFSAKEITEDIAKFI